MMTIIYYFMIFLFLFVCALLCFVILIQESKSLGLGASFGGEPGESLFGTSTASVLKKFTGYLIVIFMSLCVILSIWSSSMGKVKMKLPTVIEEEADVDEVEG